ncbi:MAG TPA: anti-sigma factor [Chloroflexia bacterium]|jgi:anti-sigma-K factor RskA
MVSAGREGARTKAHKVNGVNNNDDNMLEDNWEGRLIDYSMGTMSPADAQEFERQLNECRVHVKMADHYTQVVGWMGAAATPAEPPSGHKVRLMSRIAATPQEQGAAEPDADAVLEPLPFPPTLQTGPAMTAYSGTSERVEAAPVTNLEEYRARRAGRPRTLWIGAVAAVLALLVIAGWLSSFLGRPYLPTGYQVIAVQSQPGGPNTTAVLFYNPERRDAYFSADGLQVLDAQKVYEMWLLPKGGGNPIPAGIFNAGNSGSAWHEIQAPADMGQYAGVAVSLENAPGGTVVAGPILLVGQYDTTN